MVTVVIRDLPDDVREKLENQASRHGRSLQAEIRSILIDAFKTEKQLGLGSRLAEIARTHAVSDSEVLRLQRPRSRKPAVPIKFD